MNEVIEKSLSQIERDELFASVKSDLTRLRAEASVLRALFNPEAEPAKDVG